jgi:hypothetical protein
MNIFLVMGCMGSPEVGSGTSEPFSLWEIKIMKGFPVIKNPTGKSKYDY